MDKMLYIAMTGAKQMMRAQVVNSNNLANINTIGFRADLASFKSMPVQGPGFPTRVYAEVSTDGTSTDQSPGPLSSTGRDLDIALNGEGWIAVQGLDGKEAYTRAGNLTVSTTGVLETATGYAVLTDGGPITIPPYQKLDIATDGTIAMVPLGQSPSTQAVIGRIKLVNPPKEELVKGAEGLMNLRDGSLAPADAAVQLVSSTLEGSNVSAADAMSTMIELSRQFELQMKIMKTAQDNDASSAKLMMMG